MTDIGSACFQYCSSLSSITIPSSVTSIVGANFTGCTNLAEIKCFPTIPPTGNKGDTGANTTTCLLYVPESSIDAYKSASGWKEFKYIFAIESGETSEETTQCNAPTISYSDGKLHFTSSTEGAVYHYELSCADVTGSSYSENGSITLVAAYDITAYATADGYSASETAKATLYWINGTLDDTSAISAVNVRGVVASANNGIISVSGLAEGERVSFYTADGKLLGTSNANGGNASLSTSAKGVVIAKIGNQSIKIVAE